MLSKKDVRAAVHALLFDMEHDALLRRNPDIYHGWVAPVVDEETGEDTPGYWLGEADERQAEYRLDLAEVAYKTACEATWSNPDDVKTQQAADHARALRDEAKAQYYTTKDHRARVVADRRNIVLERRVASRFVKTYRKSMALDWDLYHTAIPESLRRYVMRQLSRPLSPTSRVFLWLTVQDTIKHGDEFQTEALTAHDYLADNPLVQSYLDIDVPEDEPSRAQRAYVRELQAQAVRDRMASGHENKDSRDILKDFEYHGLPEQLGAMWIDKGEEQCPHCQQGVRVRMIHSGSGYRYAAVCPNYKDNTQCRFDEVSPKMSSRKALRDWAVVEAALAQSA
jgi:hypothetical protein